MQPLILVGASVRSAADSARRAGYQPFCVDQFADEDLLANAVVLPCRQFPEGLAESLRSAPYVPWMYCGGLENRADVVEQLALIRPLLGNGPSALKLVRDPIWVANVLRSNGALALAICSNENFEKDAHHSALRWIKKPLASAGGRGVEFASSSSADQRRPDCFYQEFAVGLPISGVFVADGKKCVCCGLSRQLVGEPLSGAPPFGYSGSLGPLNSDDLPATCFEQVAALGELIAKTAELRGLFGIDCVWDADRGVAWLIEINPRYTASVELFELATGDALLTRHCSAAAAESQQVSDAWARPLAAARSRIGKFVLYAQRDTVVLDLRTWTAPSYSAWVADIPKPGSEIPNGAPICTVLCRGESISACYQRLLAASEIMRGEIEHGRR